MHCYSIRSKDSKGNIHLAVILAVNGFSGGWMDLQLDGVLCVEIDILLVL